MGHNNLEGNSTMNEVKKARRKRLKIIFWSLAAFVFAAIFIGHEFIHSMLSFDLTETEINAFMKQVDPKTEIVKDVLPGSVDKYQNASDDLSFYFYGDLEHPEALDMETVNDGCRHRIIRLQYNTREKAEKRFEAFKAVRITRKESASWIPWDHSLYAGFYWNDDITGPYIRVWCDKHVLTVLLSEDYESGEGIFREMKNYGRRY